MTDKQPQVIYAKDYQIPNYLLKSTDLTFDLFDTYTIVKATIALYLNPKLDCKQDNYPSLVLNGVELELEALYLNDKLLNEKDYTIDFQAETLTLIPSSREFILEVITRIYPHKNTTLEGLYLSNSMFCTQCEAEGFRRIVYYPDRPDVLSTFKTRITADQKQYPVLLSNGNLVNQGLLPNGRHFVEWEDPFKKPSYLFALVAGELEYIEDYFTTVSGKRVTLQIYTQKHNINKCQFAMDSLKQSMRWDEQEYGREYDLDRFMIVAVDHFNMGAMENKGLNIFNSSCVLATPETATDARFERIQGIVAHEYFHNWSGNRVTCRDWFQLSLKEGFTVFRDSEFTADLNSRAIKRLEDVYFLRNYQFIEDEGPLAHPIRPDSYIEISNFYTRTVYEKGSEVIRMLQVILGKANFRKGCDRYFEKFDGQAVTCEDFVKTMEEVSAIDLSQFRLWYSQAGTPRIIVDQEYNSAEQQVIVKVEQSCPATPGQATKQPFHIPLRIAILDDKGQFLSLDQQGSLEKVLHLHETKSTFTFDNMPPHTTLSLLRGFSAPVKLTTQQSLDELIHLVRYDNDAFVRWDSLQQIWLKAFQQLQNQLQQGATLDDLVLNEAVMNIWVELFEDRKIEAAFKAKLLLLPTPNALFPYIESIDPAVLCNLLDKMNEQIAGYASKPLFALWQQLDEKSKHNHNATRTASIRADSALKATVLQLLTYLKDEQVTDIAIQQYYSTHNMTDKLSALRTALNAKAQKTSEVQGLLDNFATAYEHDVNVMELWFNIQATSEYWGSGEHIKVLMTHSTFSHDNPNLVNALIGGYSNNMRHFHSKDGSGYEFLASQVLKFDQKNPRLSSRLVTPLTSWRHYHQSYAEKMQQTLAFIAENHKLSKDLTEIVGKSLKDFDSE